MLSELHNDYKNHSTKGTNFTNAVIFGDMAKRHLFNDLQSFWENVKFEINDLRRAKLRNFKPHIPSRENLIETALLTTFFVTILPLKLMSGCMNNGAKSHE